MDLARLQAFVEIARRGSLSRAARELGVSQPALTRRLAALERSTQAALFVRRRTGVSPTEAGERFLEHAVRALASVSAGMEAIETAGKGELGGLVSVGSVPTVGAYLLPDVLHRFCKEHPRVRLRLYEGWSSEMEDAVASGELQMAIVNLPLRRGELAQRQLFTEDFVLAVHETHRFANARAPIPLEDIAHERLLAVPVSPATRALEAIAEQRGFALEIVAEADNHEALRRMVARGLGIALFPRLMAEGARKRPTAVRFVDVGAGVVRRRVALVHHGRPFLGAAAQALFDAIVAHVARLASPAKRAR